MSQILYFRVDLHTVEILFAEDVVQKWDYRGPRLSISSSLFYIFSFVLDLRGVPYNVPFSNTMVLINWIQQSRKHANEGSCLCPVPAKATDTSDLVSVFPFMLSVLLTLVTTKPIISRGEAHTVSDKRNHEWLTSRLTLHMTGIV